jgi:hypothetical protein
VFQGARADVVLEIPSTKGVAGLYEVACAMAGTPAAVLSAVTAAISCTLDQRERRPPMWLLLSIG